MTMPEAAMNKYHSLVLGQNDVRRAGEVLAVKSEAVSKPVKQ